MPAKKKTAKPKKVKKGVAPPNPNHLEDFEALLTKAAKPQKPSQTSGR